jgi:hypothetical protein
MLRSIKELKNYTLQAKDGEIGQVVDVYFDDDQWTVRYLVVDTGKWLPGRRVLINRLVLGQPDWKSHAFPVDLTKNQVKNSPDIDLAQPVSRQAEMDLAQHYQWPLYWSIPGGVMYYTGIPPAEEILKPEDSQEATAATDEQTIDDPHLRSLAEVLGYYIQAQDGEIGHVEDFIVDDEVWVIRYLVTDTKNWWPGKKVLVSPHWIEAFDWQKKHVEINLHRETIKNSPEYDPAMPVNREYEIQLYDYYGRPKYWIKK